MKIYKKLIITSILLLNFSFAHSEEQIVYLDLDNIVANTKAGKLIISNLEKSKKSTLANFEKKEKELKKIENDINKQKNILSEEELKKKLIEFRKEINIFQTDRQNVINKFNKKKVQEFNNFFKKITPIIQSYLSEKNIDIVLDKKNIFVASKKKILLRKLLS